MKVPEWLRGKAVDDPEVLSWRYGYLLEQACAALDRCFRSRSRVARTDAI